MPVPKHRLFYIMKGAIDDYLKPSIDSESKYWMMRTMGGDFYKEFVEDGFIAIGYNEITIENLKMLPESESLSKEVLAIKLKERCEDIKNTAYPASQILKFYREMKVGDFVVVPGRSSHYVSFGVITSDVFEAEDKYLHSADLCPFAKRRTVNWKKSTVKFKLNPTLQLMFGSRHIISDVDDYAPHIDNLLNDFYTKGNNTYLVLRVKQDQELSADDFTLVGDLMTLFNDYSREFNLGLTSADVKMKMRVQSEGDILAFAQSLEGIAIIGLIIMFIKGGTFSINCGKFTMETKVPSLGETFSQIATSVNVFLNDRSRRLTIEKLSKKLDNMEIETPSAIISMMNELGKESMHKKNDLKNID